MVLSRDFTLCIGTLHNIEDGFRIEKLFLLSFLWVLFFLSLFILVIRDFALLKAKHFVLLPNSMEKKVGEFRMELIKDKFKGKILPARHPESIRVRLIAKDIIEALEKGLKLEQMCSADLGHVSLESDAAHGTLRALSESDEGKVVAKWINGFKRLETKVKKEGQQQMLHIWMD